jgi:hypothetical protein
MEWSNFTKKYILIFKKTRIKFNNNYLLDLLKTEKLNIIKFIKENKLLVLIKKINNDENDRDYLKFTNSKFVDKNNVINETKFLKKNYLIEWNNNKIFIKANNCKSILLRIKILIFIIEYLKYKSNTYKDVLIYLLLTKLKKEIPENSDIILDAKHCNSGYTNNRYIFIWRQEEFEKVLLHEIIHYLDFDCRHNNMQLNFNIDGPQSFFESITDFWGIFYHLIFISILTNISLKLLFEIEFTFIKNQAHRLNNFLNLNNWSNIDNIIIKQNTAAFSYYILKYLLLKNIYF